MSKKYEHRIKSLKDHKENKEETRHSSNPRPYTRTHKMSKEKKNFSDMRKKFEKSKKIW